MFNKWKNKLNSQWNHEITLFIDPEDLYFVLLIILNRTPSLVISLLEYFDLDKWLLVPIKIVTSQLLRLKYLDK